jgi:hypothetical protein
MFRPTSLFLNIFVTGSFDGGLLAGKYTESLWKRVVFVVKAFGLKWIPFWGTSTTKNRVTGDGECESKEMLIKTEWKYKEEEVKST